MSNPNLEPPEIEELPQAEALAPAGIFVTEASDYRILKPSVFDHKAVRAGILGAIIVVLAIAASQLQWAAPTPRVEANAEFQRIAIPTKSAAPPPPTPTATMLPPLPTVSVKQTAPVTMAAPPVHFDEPKIDVTKMMDTALSRMSTPSNSAGQGQTYAPTGNGTVTNTTSIGDLEGALKSDGRPGQVIGGFSCGLPSIDDAVTLDTIRRNDSSSIGWFIDAPGYPKGINHGSGIPVLHELPRRYNFLAEDYDVLGVGRYLVAHNAHDIKTYVLVENFNTPFSGSPPEDHGSTYSHEKMVEACDALINALRQNNVRLCVISFRNAPYPPLLDYIRATGGVCLYPHGVPADASAAQLKQTVSQPQQ